MKNPFPYLLMLFLIAAFFHAEFLLYAVYAMLGVVLLSRWWARRALGKLTYLRRYESHVFLGDAISVSVELHNTGRLPCAWVVVRESLPVELAGSLRVAHAVSLAPGERRTFQYELQGRRRGLYRLGPMRLDSGDLLGQEEYHALGHEDDRVTVYPQIVTLDRLGLPSLSPFGHLRSRERLYADPSRTGGVRDYAQGDSARDVHWSASAAAGTLQVKTYEPAMSLPTALLLDMSLAAYDRWQGSVATELGVVVAASLAAALGAARQEIAFFSNGRDPLGSEPDVTGLAMGKGHGHLVRLLELLARIEAVRDASEAVLLGAARLRLPWGSTVVAIGPAGNLAYRAALLALRRSGFNVVQVVLGARGSTIQSGVPTYYVNSIDDLEVWRRAGR